MALERTLSIVKPDGVSRNLIGEVYRRFEQAGLRLIASRMIQLSQREAEGFYAVHRERPFFRDLVRYMTSGPIVVQVLEGEGAIGKNREIMGATDPKKAAKGTIRADLATSIEQNVVHGSDSPENAAQEIAYFFATTQLFSRSRARHTAGCIMSSSPPLERLNLLGLTRQGLEAHLAELGSKPFRARQLLGWIYKRGEDRIEQMTDLAKDFRPGSQSTPRFAHRRSSPCSSPPMGRASGSSRPMLRRPSRWCSFPSPTGARFASHRRSDAPWIAPSAPLPSRASTAT